MMHMRQPQTEMDGRGGGGNPPLKAKSHNLNQRAISYLLYFRFEIETLSKVT